MTDKAVKKKNDVSQVANDTVFEINDSFYINRWTEVLKNLNNFFENIDFWKCKSFAEDCKILLMYHDTNPDFLLPNVDYLNNLNSLFERLNKIYNSNDLCHLFVQSPLLNSMQEILLSLLQKLKKKIGERKFDELKLKASKNFDEKQIKTLSLAALDTNYNQLKDTLEDVKSQLENIKVLDTAKERRETRRLLNELKKQKELSDELVGDIAENKNAIKYMNYAADNRKSARWLFWIGISVMAVAAIGSAWHLWNIEYVSMLKLWVRIPLMLLILMPAFFMMRESKKLKDKEFQYHDLACRIITSGPYIDSLNLKTEEKDKLKAGLVSEFFGRAIECREDGGLPPVSEISEIIRACLEKKS